MRKWAQNITPEVIKVSKNLCKFCNFIFLDKIPRKFHKKEKCGVSFKFLEVSSVENTFKLSIYYILQLILCLNCKGYDYKKVSNQTFVAF